MKLFSLPYERFKAFLAVRKIKLKSFFHLFPPDGVSGIVVVAESHFSIHTWPEHGYSAIDIFTCGDRIKSKEALNYLKKNLKAMSSSSMELQRGPSGSALIQNADSD